MSQPPPAGAPKSTPGSEFGTTTVSGSPPKAASRSKGSAPATKPAGNGAAAPATQDPATSQRTGSPSRPAGPAGPRQAPAGGPAWNRPPLVTGTAVNRGAAAPSQAPPLPGEQIRPPVSAAGAPGGPGAPAGVVPGGVVPGTGPAQRTAANRGPRRARLQVRHINPVTVLRFSCVLAVALFFVWLIVVGVLYVVLDASGVIGKVNDTVTTINGPGSKAPVSGGIVFGGAAIVGVINVVLFIALTTVGALVYNLCADLVGGIEVTLSER